MVHKYNFDIIALTETWIKDHRIQEQFIQINSYNTVMRNRDEKRQNGEDKRGGGVCFYFKQHISFQVRHDLSKIEPSIETL